MKAFRTTIIVGLCVLLSACAEQIPPLNYSPPNIGVSDTKLNAEVKSITVSLARPDEVIGKWVNGMGPANATIWKDALQESLDRMAIFRDDSPKKISISVKILQTELPAFALDMTCTVTARYDLIDRATGGIIFTTTVTTTGTVPANYAFHGVVRAREAVSRATQNNSSEFLQQLETVNLSKPMFPTHRK